MKERTRTRKGVKQKETKGEEEGTKARKGRGKGGMEKGRQSGKDMREQKNIKI